MYGAVLQLMHGAVLQLTYGAVLQLACGAVLFACYTIGAAIHEGGLTCMLHYWGSHS